MNSLRFSVFYVSIIWLTYCYTVPFEEWTGIPLYVLVAPLMFAVIPQAAVTALAMAVPLLLYECLKFVQPDFQPTTKGFIGLIVLSCIFALCYHCIHNMRSMSDKAIGTWLRWILYIMFGAIIIDHLLGFAGLKPSEYPHYFLPIDRRSGLLSEPSFLALAISPYIFMIVQNYGLFKRYMGNVSLAILVLIVILCPSATLTGIIIMSLVLAAFKYVVKGRSLGIFGSIVAVVALVTAIVAIPEVALRFNDVFSGDVDLQEQNMSSLAFTKGRQMATYAAMHFPLGVSFLNMEYLVPYADASYVNDFIYDLNSNDGSSVLFKGISEFGFLFIITFFFGLLRFIKAMISDDGSSFFVLVILAFQFAAFSHFLRGASYFDGVIAIGFSTIILDGARRVMVILSSGRRTATDDPTAPDLAGGGPQSGAGML